MISRRRALLIGSSIFGASLAIYIFTGAPYIYDFQGPDFRPQHDPQSEGPDLRPCYGPRGVLGPENLGDQVLAVEKNWEQPNETPLWGSYEALGLVEKWTTGDIRYGPYGFGEDLDTYNRTVVDWQRVDWAGLQNDCVSRNREHFPRSKKVSPQTRFERPSQWKISKKLPGLSHARKPTDQTAIVLRAWDAYSYQAEDFYHIRSIITETALRSSGKYTVFLLIEVKDEQRRQRMYKSQHEYKKVIDEFVPPEFRNMAVLFDQDLLRSWYPLVPEHKAEFQMYQAMQLFAHLYDFDHYWQLEMDAKFLVDTHEYLDALSSFARAEPRKQSLERGAYRYMPDLYPTYEKFIHAVDAGQTSPLRQSPYLDPQIPEIPNPIGLPPPFLDSPTDPFESDFFYGVGEDADVILTNTVVSIPAMTRWPYKTWIHHSTLGFETPRLQSPVSITRSSNRLLQVMHVTQVEKGLAVPSEATGPSFAFWHRLKISYPPSPFFMKTKRNIKEIEKLYNGGPVEDGGRGPALYDPQDYWAIARDGTWHWGGSWPRQIMDAYLGIERKIDDEDGDPEKLKMHELPWLMRKDKEGRIWAPSLPLHPVKTN